MAAIYLDSSAIVKLAVREPESDALRRYLRTRHPRVSSALARAEVMRALLDKGESATGLHSPRQPRPHPFQPRTHRPRNPHKMQITT